MDNYKIFVWDIIVRIFHWSLVILFFIAFMTGDDAKFTHIYTGYAILSIVIIRIFWGFFGTKYALFRDFICSPLKSFEYIKELISGNPKHYIGHNPAAAMMIVLFIATTMVICISGHKEYVNKGVKFSAGLSNEYSFISNAYADEDEKEDHEENHKENGEIENDREEKNLLASNEKGDKEKNNELVHNEGEGNDSIWHDIHEVSAKFMLVLIGLHVIGVAASSKLHNENLVKSMITGKKDIKPA
jgi:cytochrome b